MGKDVNGVVPEWIDPPATVGGWVSTLACPSPDQIDGHLEALGYRGQAEARRAVSCLAHRHVLRLRRRYLDGVPASRLMARDACLLSGPSGSGKSHLLRLLCDEVLDVPAVIIDASQLTDCVDVNQVATTVVSWLVHAARGDANRAACGVICLDGLERVPCTVAGDGAAESSSEWARRHWRVQQAMITLLSARYVSYDQQPGPWRRARSVTVPLQAVSIIACGSLDRTGSGFLPELLRGFTTTARLAPHGRAELASIMDVTVRWYRRELGPEIGFAPSPEVLSGILESAVRGGGVHELLHGLGQLIDEVADEEAKRENG
jgi:hypothetical protein